ncbi:retention in endoplasmic reticulum protein 1 [Hanseniaspora osmophila]
MESYESAENPMQKQLHGLHTLYQTYLDRTTPHKGYRWIAWGALFFVFFMRVVYLQGFYVVCYAYSIFALNQFLLFLTPKFDMSLQQDEANNNLESGADGDDDEERERSGDAEFRPFIRRLPEFKFWYKCIIGVIVSNLMTFFSIFDLPVFWPILVMYFILLFVLTMRRQIQHMIKYKYIPLDVGKKKYGKAEHPSKAGTTMNL